MEFEWDDSKNASNFEKHGLSFEEAATIFKGPYFTRIDGRKDYGEVREISIGEIEGAVVVVVVHTDRKGVARIISARKAKNQERDAYYEHCAKTFD